MNEDLEEVIDEVDENGTSEEVVENQVTTKTYSEEELQAKLEEQRNQINEDNQKAWNKRWGREKSKMEKEYAQKDELINLLKKQTEKDSIADLLDYSYEQYGIEKPNVSNSKDEEILGKYDAKEILELDDETIEEEANRLAEITNRSVREQATFMELGNYLTTKKEQEKRKKEIKDAGIDEEVYNNQDFKDFMSKFNKDTSVSDIYELYSKTHETTKKKPFSAGSAKGTNKQDLNEVKDYYTYEESLQFTKADFDKNPKLFEAVERSMTRWGKK